MTTDLAKRVMPAVWAAGDVGPIVGVDFETFYSSSYSVSEMGNWAYVHDARFCAWAVSVSDGQRTCVCTPEEFPWGTIAGREWVSHHRNYDEAVYSRLVELGRIGRDGARPSKWHCSAALCAYLQLPRALAGAVRAVFGIEVDKSERKRAKGRDCGPDLFGQSEQGAAYAASDAELTLALWLELEKHWPAHERRLFDLTCDMGRDGLCVDWSYVTSNLAELNATVEGLARALPWSPALSIPRFEAACEQIGTFPPRSTSAKDPEFSRWLSNNQRSEAATWVRHMQRIRSANRTAKVLEGMLERRMSETVGGGRLKVAGGEIAPRRYGEHEGGRMSYELRYFGASTGRWAGGGGLNMQNYNRTPAEGVDLRRCITAPPDYVLAVVDYSQIESRVLLFLAGDVETLAMFQANPEADAYEIHARATMGYAEAESLVEYCARTRSGLRQLAKARVLGLGFGCGARRFIEVARVMAGLEIGDEESERIVREFREANPKIVALWRNLNDACASCDGGDYVLPLPCTQVNPDLKRYLFYRDVRLQEPEKKTPRIAADGKGWAKSDVEIICTVAGERIKVYGGLLAENWTQATARDVLASAWLRCDAAGYRPVLSVHDELIFEVPEASAAEDLRRIVEIMEQPVPWAPGLPLRAEGKLCAVYGK